MTNDINKISKFQEAMSRARRLTQMDANGDINKLRDNAISEGKMSYSADGVMVNIPEQSTQQPMQVNLSNASTSKLPKAIIESMQKNPINTDILGVDVGTASVLDVIMPQVKTKQTVKEERVANVNQRMVENTASSIDYSLVKTIVEDCMKKYLGALKKSIINENRNIIGETNSLQAMKIGNKFTFIDNAGNVYEASLKKKYNINEQKTQI